MAATRLIRNDTTLSLIVYCTSFLIFYKYYSGDNFWNETDALYLAATILINIGSVVLFLYDFITGKPNQIVNIVCSIIMIVGALCYLIAFAIDIQNINGYEIAYYIGCVIFIAFKTFILSALILSNQSTPTTKVLTKSVVSILCGICMIYYWINNKSSATNIEFDLIMSGWGIISIISIGIIIYESIGSNNKGVAISCAVIVSVGSLLLLIGSILYNVGIDENINNLQISSEWALSFSVFIASITTGIAIGSDNDSNDENQEKKLNESYNMMINNDETINIQI